MNDVIKNCFDAYQTTIKCSDKNISCPNCMRGSYYNGSLQIDYTCEKKSFLYVCRYLPVHQKELHDAIYNSLQYLSQNINKITLASIGSGPGTDIFAYCNAMQTGYATNKLKNMSSSILAIDKYMNSWSGAFDIVTKNVPYDICKYANDFASESVELPYKINLFVLSYFVSELNDDEINQLAINLRNNAAKHACIVINERPEDSKLNKAKNIMSNLTKGKFSHIENNDHCGFHFEKEIADECLPKFCTTSVCFYGVI